MIVLFDEQQRLQLRSALSANRRYREIYDVCLAMARRESRREGILQAGDTTGWWYLAMPRMRRCAALLALSWDEELALWLRGAAQDVLSRAADEWVGPFFRKRTDPPEGTLEAAALSNALSYSLMLCPQAFSPEEAQRIRERLSDTAMPLLWNWLTRHARPGMHRNNFCIVILNGYISACVALEAWEALDRAIEYYNDLITLLNTDYYGEAVNYWGYTLTQFAETHMLLSLASPPHQAKLADPALFVRTLTWASAHRAGKMAVEAVGSDMPRYINLGDTGAMCRPLGTLLSILATMEQFPESAAMASEWFEDAYRTEWIDPPNTGLLGFFDVIGFWPLMLYPRFADPSCAPALPAAQRFADGFSVLRAETPTGRLIFAVQSGFSEVPRTVSHRHADQQSVWAQFNGVMLLEDPGHCCYRLPLQAVSRQDASHSTPCYRLEGAALAQGNMNEQDTSQPLRHQLTCGKAGANWLYTGGDAAALYPAPLTKAERRVLVLGPHIALVEDLWAADAPLQAGARFIVNNRGMRLAYEVSDAESRLCREGVGVRIVPLQESEASIGYVTLHDNYHMYPGAPVQGREGSGISVTYGQRQAERSGCFRTLLVLDEQARLGQWRCEATTTGIRIYEPGGALYAQILGSPAQTLVFGETIDLQSP